MSEEAKRAPEGGAEAEAGARSAGSAGGDPEALRASRARLDEESPEWGRMHPQTEWIVLVGAIGVLLVAAILPMPQGGEVHLFGQVVPPICPSRAAGFACPGCGMTRALICWVHGDPGAGLGFHRLSLLALLLIAGQIPYRIWRLRGGAALPQRFSDAILVGFPVLLVLNWLIGFAL